MRVCSLSKKNPEEEDWHRHSYAMNKDLQHDFLYKDASRPKLTEKNLARIIHRPSALLYIENEDSNVIGYEDIEAIRETGEKRWSSGKVLASFLDGHVANLHPEMDIPDRDPFSDRRSSRFWRGVDTDSYSGD